MISLEEALSRIEKAVVALTPRKVSLLEAVGSCLSEDIVSTIDVPGFASSAMDGVALAAADLSLHSAAEPTVLNLLEIIPAGQTAKKIHRPGGAFRIMTGAPLPAGTDTVVPYEDVELAGRAARITAPVEPGQHVRPLGDDLKAGQVVFKAGYRLRPVDVGICAGMGLREVSVYPKPSVAVAATGSEIRPPDEKLRPGQIYNSNDTSLRALLVANGYSDPGEISPLKDDPDELVPSLERLCKRSDVVITSGAVSAGDYDFIPKVVEKLKGKVLFYKVAIKPGMPTLMAKVFDCWLLSLPGNPVSAVVTFHLYGKRLLWRLSGYRGEPTAEKARLTEPLDVEGGRFRVVGACLKRTEQGLFANAASRYRSGRLSSIAGIDGFILTPGGTRTIPAGTVVDVEWL